MNECRDIQRLIWSGEADGRPIDAHVERCADCRTELRRSQQLGVALGGLRQELAPVPAGLESALISVAHRRRIERARGVIEHPRFWRGAAVGAAATAAATAAAVGLIVARRRARPGLAA